MTLRHTARVALVVIGLAYAGCDGDGGRPRVLKTQPGLQVQFQTALSGATWTLVEAGGGTLSDTGLYTAPPCGVGVPGVYHVKASSAGQEQVFTVTVEDAVQKVEIVCWKRVGGAVCTPGSNATIAPGEQVQFYAKVTRSCSTEWAPSRPAGF
jgi:hypothetical protein